MMSTTFPPAIASQFTVHLTCGDPEYNRGHTCSAPKPSKKPASSASHIQGQRSHRSRRAFEQVRTDAPKLHDNAAQNRTCNAPNATTSRPPLSGARVAQPFKQAPPTFRGETKDVRSAASIHAAPFLNLVAFGNGGRYSTTRCNELRLQTIAPRDRRKAQRVWMGNEGRGLRPTCCTTPHTQPERPMKAEDRMLPSNNIGQGVDYGGGG